MTFEIQGGWSRPRLPFVQSSGNFTAALNERYNITATATVTDPTPAEGRGFESLVRNGTATIGGTAYATAGAYVHRLYHSGAWSNYVYPHLDAAWTWTQAQTINPASGVVQTWQQGGITRGLVEAGGQFAWTGGNAVALTSGQYFLRVGGEAGNHVVFDFNSIQAKNAATGSNDLRINPLGGNVGIGVTPVNGYKLQTNGAILATVNAEHLILAASTSGTSRWSVGASDYNSGPTYTGVSLVSVGSTAAGTGGWVTGVPNAGLHALWFQNPSGLCVFGSNGVQPFIWAPASTERMRLDSNGNLGIGVTPTAGNGLLQLASGTTRANGIWMGDFPVFRSGAGILALGDGTTAVSTATTVGAAGGGSALPATPVTYLRISINGTIRKIPLYTD